LEALALLIVAPIAAALIQMAISRSREYAADAKSAELTGNPLGLARALAKLRQASEVIPMQADPNTAHLFIVSPLSAGSFLNLFGTHPPLEERIARLERLARGE
jgi:heat shock protein HtpX